MPERPTIQIACTGVDVIDIEQTRELQDDLKSLSDADYGKLRHEIVTTGFAFPLALWRDTGGVMFVVGGHQRRRVLLALRAEGFEIPPVPYVLVEARGIVAARRRVLQDAAQYGRIETQGLYEYMHDANLRMPDLSSSFRLPDLNMEKFRLEYFAEPDTSAESSSGSGSEPSANPAAAITARMIAKRIKALRPEQQLAVIAFVERLERGDDPDRIRLEDVLA